MKILAEPIDTLVMFKGNEKPMPYRFKYVDQEGIRQEVKIDKILYTEESRMAGVRAFIYSCQSMIEEEEKIIALREKVRQLETDKEKLILQLVHFERLKQENEQLKNTLQIQTKGK